MGGRGTFAAGNAVPYTYEVDRSFFPEGKLNGVKILKGMEGTGKHGLPESSHSSSAYLKMDKNGEFNTLRIYDANHNLRIEIAYHSEQGIAKGKDKVLHYHLYDKAFSSTRNGSYERTTQILHKNSKLYQKYKKFFIGVK